MVIATEKQGLPIRFTDPSSSDLEPSQQSESASRARMNKETRKGDWEQNSHEPGDEHRRLILNHRPLERIARVQGRLGGLADMPVLSPIDAFSLR